MTALVYTVIEAPNWGWSSAHTAVGFAVGVVVLAAFALWERRTPASDARRVGVRNRRFSGGSLAVTAGFLTLFGFIFVITQYFQFIKGYSAFETGVRLLPVAISIAVASIVGPRIVERIGTTAVVAGGLAHLRGRACVGVDRRRRYALHPNRLADGASRRRPGADHRAGHRVDHGVAVRRQGRRRLGRQRHHPRTRRHPRRRDRRQRVRVRVFGPTGQQRRGGRAARARCAPRWNGRWPPPTQVIGRLPQQAVPDVRAAVNTAFLDGLQVGSLVCAGIAVGAAVIVAWLLPARARQAADRSGTSPRRCQHEPTPTRGPTATAPSNTSPAPTDPACGTSPQAAARRWC